LKEKPLGNWCRCVFLLVLIACPAAADAAAKDTQKFLGSFGNWRAYASHDAKRPVCYMALALHAAKKKGFKRGAAYLMITHRPTEGSTDVVSYMAGYNFKAGSDAHVRLGTTAFDLFTQDTTAWTRDAHTDHALAAAIRAHDSLTISGVPTVKGAGTVTDKLSLKGAADAYRAIGKACGLKTEAPAKVKVKQKSAKTAKKAATQH
jgi:hypothetical protein